MSYRKDIKSAWERVRAIPSRTFESSLGPVEYALEGKGPPLLMSHGIQGSHAEGISMVGTYAGTGWMGIAPSRFGHFGSALPNDATPALSRRRLRRTPRPSRCRPRGRGGLLVWRNIRYRAGAAPPRSTTRARPCRLCPTTVVATSVVLAPLFSAITRTEQIFWALRHTPGVMRGLGRAHAIRADPSGGEDDP